MEKRGKAVNEASWGGMRWTFANDTFEVQPGRSTPAGIAKKSPLKCSYALDDTEVPRRLPARASGWCPTRIVAIRRAEILAACRREFQAAERRTFRGEQGDERSLASIRVLGWFEPASPALPVAAGPRPALGLVVPAVWNGTTMICASLGIA
jgi:hypothetical protein